MDSLNTIFVRHGADKQEAAHGYAKHYEPLFEPWRKEPIVLLEIGVWRGASMASWLEYFEDARVIGLDCDSGCWKTDNPRYTWFFGDQCNESFLFDVCETLPRLDVVIDDGCHQPHAQAKSFQCLWPKLSPGGIYCIEDIHPWFDPKHNAVYHDGAQHLLWHLANSVNWSGCRYPGRPFEDEAPTGYDQGFESIFMAKGLLIIRKAGLHFSQTRE